MRFKELNKARENSAEKFAALGFTATAPNAIDNTIAIIAYAAAVRCEAEAMRDLLIGQVYGITSADLKYSWEK